MADGPKRMLRGAIESHLIPALTERGFHAVPLTGADAKSRELRIAFPFGRHRRVSPDGQYQMVEVQIHPNRVAFTLNLGVAPVEGVTRASVHTPQDEVWVHDLPLWYRLFRWPRFRSWFSLWLVPLKSRDATPIQEDYDALATRVAQLLPEVDALFAQGKRGKHIRVIDLR